MRGEGGRAAAVRGEGGRLRCASALAAPTVCLWLALWRGSGKRAGEEDGAQGRQQGAGAAAGGSGRAAGQEAGRAAGHAAAAHLLFFRRVLGAPWLLVELGGEVRLRLRARLTKRLALSLSFSLYLSLLALCGAEGPAASTKGPCNRLQARARTLQRRCPSKDGESDQITLVAKSRSQRPGCCIPVWNLLGT